MTCFVPVGNQISILWGERVNHSYIALRLEASRSGDFQSPFFKMGDFKSPLLGLRHPRTRNHALVFKLLGMTRK
jgi:hypothetical protein